MTTRNSPHVPPGGPSDESSGDRSSTDGRRLRREQGRLVTLDATIDLILAGISPPTVEQIASEAGVSVASVYRYFDSNDELRKACIWRYLDRYSELMAIPEIGHCDLAERIRHVIESRLRFYETVEPIARFARREATQSTDMDETLQRVRATLSDQLAQQFAVELDRLRPAERAERLAVVSLLTSFEGWDQMAAAGLSRDSIARAWSTHLTVLLDETAEHDD
jgi:AcrR family transcriptional regulator